MDKEQTLQKIPLDLCDDHPDNPRLAFRDDVIDAIAASIAEHGYPQYHAIIVRPLNGRYQILSGHQRVRAARKAGLSEVWAWVQPLSDDEALMQLVLTNVQGELSPLEIGIHCLKAIPPQKGGRGIKGGLAQYARQIGKTQGWLSQVRQAAEVASSVVEKPISQLIGFSLTRLLDKATHLSVVHALPRELWPEAVSTVVQKDLSVEEVEQRVRKTLDFLKDHGISEQWQRAYLPPQACAMAVFRGEEAPLHFKTLSRLADEVLQSLQEHQDLAKSWIEWLETNTPDSWDIRKVQEKRNEIDQIRLSRHQTSSAPCIVYQRDAIEFLQDQEDRSFDLLLTDPPYMTDVEDIYEFARKWVPLALQKLKLSGRAYIFTGAYPQELHAYLSVLLDQDTFALDNILVWTYRNTMGPSPKMGYKLNWQAIFYLYGPEAPPLQCPVLLEQLTVQEIAAPGTAQSPRLHTWQKPDALAEMLIRHSTKENNLILDPFVGTGTFLVAAQKLGRLGVGTEIDQEMIKICEQRGLYVHIR